MYTCTKQSLNIYNYYYQNNVKCLPLPDEDHLVI